MIKFVKCIVFYYVLLFMKILQSDCEQKRQLVRSLKKKLEDKESDQRNSKFALNVLLKETSDLLERNKYDLTL